MRKSLLALVITGLIMASITDSFAGNKIKYYFNRAVDTTASTGTNAVYLNNCIADTLSAYINRANYSLDICMYDYESTYSYNIATVDTVFAPEVARAINNAYARGVKIRYIYEASNANTGIGLLDTNIHTLGSPQGPDYTIMHNKFIVIDAASPDPNDPIVWTGCMNWYYEQFNWDYNNVVVLQDSMLAYAYTAEFNMMWGDTGIVPDTLTSKFGQYKTDLGMHNFTIDGHHVELYFSPSDGTDNHIQSTIESANKDLYVGMYTFTESTDANDIVHKYDSGLTVYAINDSYSDTYYPSSTFTTNLVSHYKIYTESTDTIYHNKFLVVDPSDTCSDPMVLTGSHNWTTSANTKNDENTLIIHDATAANLYLQYFKSTFQMLGGTLTTPAYNCIPLGINMPGKPAGINFSIFPNPSYGNINISYQLVEDQSVSLSIYNIQGEEISKIIQGEQQNAGSHHYSCNISSPGLYYIKMVSGNTVTMKKVLVLNQ